MNFSDRDFHTSLSSMDLDKVSSHKYQPHETITDKFYNQVNKMDTTRMENKSGSDLEPLLFHQKRSKPRRLSGLQGANINEDNFKQSRPFLARDDSIFHLKQRTTNAIPMFVPLVPADTPNDEKLEQRPLSRIQRRRKPRRLSGDAVQNETRPVLVRDDSVVLTKKKLAGEVPLTLEYEEGLAVPLEPNRSAERKKKTTKTTPTRSASVKVPRMTGRQKQHGYVRQNSCGARTA